MTAKYYAILTNQGAARLANATALGTKLNLTQMAVGDANGKLPTPDPAQTALINQQRIAPLNMLTVDPDNASQIIAEQIIPENEGGFWIREIGLYDDGGVLIAVANCPETYKPQLAEGSGRTQTIRMILIVSSTTAITLKIDPSVVLATRQYVDDKVIEVKSYADELMKAHLAAANPHSQYLPLAGGDVIGRLGVGGVLAVGKSGTESVITLGASKVLRDNANNALIISSESGAGTKAGVYLRPLASTDSTMEMHGDSTGWNTSKLTVSTLALGNALGLQYGGTGAKTAKDACMNLGLGEGSALPVGVPVPWSTATAPYGWLKCNGATFDKTKYPGLAVAYPSGKLPDLRGEFIRGLDDGRGVDSGRAILSVQGDAIRNITGSAAAVSWDGGGIDNNWGAYGAFGRTIENNGTRVPNSKDGQMASYTLLFDASRVVNTASENRPRNIAFNYIVRAA